MERTLSVEAMCGRTSRAADVGTLRTRFSATPAAGVTIRPRYNIAPRDDLVAITNEAPEVMDHLEWGLLPHWADDPDDIPRPINARSETVAEKPMFRDAFEQRRCLVLADGFYEWKGSRGSKQPYRIERPNREPFAFAGLWETWEQNGVTLGSCTILTTEANDLVADVHDRMPVILEPQAERTWLNGAGADELQSLCKPYPSDGLRAYPVSKRVNNPENDSPDLLEKIDIGEQSGLEEFGS
jgi:putative SOS response-associated peptidase YedK